MGTTCCQTSEKIHFESEIIKTQPKPTISGSAAFLNQFLSSHPTISRVLAIQQQYQSYQKQFKKDKLLATATLTHELEGKLIGVNSMLQHEPELVIMVSNNNEYYEGYSYHGQKNGKGILVNDEGQYYCGEWKQNLPHGYGVYQYVNPHAIYRGAWQRGLKHGRGEEVSPDGSKYVGSYLMGERNGQGKLIYSPDSFYEGEFANNKPDGIGFYQSKSQTYEGTWKAGKMHGVGKCEWYSNDQPQRQLIGTYFGEYRQGIKQGYGEYTDSKGTTYKGMWLNGELNDFAPIDICTAEKPI